ncbi:MAG: carbohydrate kinase [Microcystaceae cyanobacterium]
MAQVICIGEILFDLLADQLGKELSDVNSWTAYPGGAPANVACGLVKLGISSAFIGCIGNDNAGAELKQLLGEVGVNIDGVQSHPTAPTRQVYVTRSLTGERTFAGFGEISTTEFADAQFNADLLSSSLFKEAQYLVTGTLGLAYTGSFQGMMKAVELAKQHKVKIFLDINWRPVFWDESQDPKTIITPLLQSADIIKCSDEEAQWLFNTEEPRQIEQYCPQARGILVTAGEKGCTYKIGDLEGHQEVFEVKSTDTTGAGDSFVAGFLAQCCHMGDRIFDDPTLAKQAIRYASAVGALTTTQPGAIASQPTAEEVNKFLR